jgi:hypothetical protein
VCQPTDGDLHKRHAVFIIIRLIPSVASHMQPNWTDISEYTQTCMGTSERGKYSAQHNGFNSVYWYCPSHPPLSVWSYFEFKLTCREKSETEMVWLEILIGNHFMRQRIEWDRRLELSWAEMDRNGAQLWISYVPDIELRCSHSKRKEALWPESASEL